MIVDIDFDMTDFRTLRVWEAFHKITLRVYALTKRFSSDELYGLTSQMRRSSALIATNIAEGCGRHTDPDMARFLNIATESASELEYQLLLSKDLAYIDQSNYETIEKDLTTAKKMLNTFIQKIRTRTPLNPKNLTPNPKTPNP